MPYKHIAAHLQKTELACRLHYHQLSFGTKRRRRSPSTPYTKSTHQQPAIYGLSEGPHRGLPHTSPPTSPENMLPENRMSTSTTNPVSILPKPVPAPHGGTPPGPSLHLVTQDIERLEERSHVDKSRLDKIYDAHRSYFWSIIARDYGNDVSPEVLEEVWCQTIRFPLSDYLPTPPARSPQSETTETTSLGPWLGESSTGNGSRPNNVRNASTTPSVPTRSSFAISSLLTEDKEVRSPGYSTYR